MRDWLKTSQKKRITLETEVKVIVAGGRDFKPTPKAVEWLRMQLLRLGATHVLCGKAKGADTMGEQVALSEGIDVLYFPADWENFGNTAGFRRNQEMAQVADHLIIFPGGSGSMHMTMWALYLGIPITVFPPSSF